MSEENWRPILGGTYSVSSAGAVRRDKPYRGRVGALKPNISPYGYAKVSVSVNGKSKQRSVHSLVLEAFVGPRPLGMVINHKDGNKLNNCPENLEYVTDKQNHEHAAALGLAAYGERIFAAKITTAIAGKIKRMIIDGLPSIKIARKLGVSVYIVYKIKYGQDWKRAPVEPK